MGIIGIMSSIQNAEKKFIALTNTQEGIESMSLWVNHHKDHSDQIVRSWYKVLKKCKFLSGNTVNFLLS